MATKATLDYAYRRLINIFDETRVTRDPFERFVYENSFAQLPKGAEAQFRLRPDFAVLPRAPGEVSRTVLLGEELELPIIPRGAGSSIHGGGVSNVGGILVDMRTLNRIIGIDPQGLTVTVEAGATWKTLYDYLAYKGFFLPVYPDFAPSATVGGEIGNGAVGIGALKYGPLGDWVRSLQVVVPGGAMVDTGFDEVGLGHRNLNTTSLYYGAEGTLGIITRATLAILPMYEALKPLAYGFGDFRAATAAVARLPGSGAQPYHVEVVDGTHLLIEDSLGYDVPEAGAAVSLVMEGAKDAVAAEAKAVDEYMAAAGGTKLSDTLARQQWDERFDRFRGRRLSGGMVVSRALVPLARLGDLQARSVKAASGLKMDVAFRGYLADRSSAEVTPYWLTNDRSFKSRASLGFIKKFHDLVVQLGGHPQGLGFLLSFSLGRMHGAEADVIRDIKLALDPRNLMNRGKFVATMGRSIPIPPLEEMLPEIPARAMVLGLRALGGAKKLLPRDHYIPPRRRRPGAPKEE